jgi:hypothetical protein
MMTRTAKERLAAGKGRGERLFTACRSYGNDRSTTNRRYSSWPCRKESRDWKPSIVDLMKLVRMDSSFGARKQLATELHYTGDPNDSAAMNVWLHKQVLIKLSQNGGKVPQELLR